MVGVLMQNEEGVFYKAVKPDMKDLYSGKYQYVERKGDKRKLERNQSVECGEGWHWTSYKRAVSFADKKPHLIISAKIKMKDILSVYNKVRVKEFSDVKIVKL
jgi:hypothetical protein